MILEGGGEGVDSGKDSEAREAEGSKHEETGLTADSFFQEQLGGRWARLRHRLARPAALCAPAGGARQRVAVRAGAALPQNPAVYKISR